MDADIDEVLEATNSASAMIIIDTETRKYEKVPVMGKLGYKVCTVTYNGLRVIFCKINLLSMSLLVHYNETNRSSRTSL